MAAWRVSARIRVFSAIATYNDGRAADDGYGRKRRKRGGVAATNGEMANSRTASGDVVAW